PNIRPAFHGAGHRHFVRVFEVGADGDAHGNAGDTDAERLQQPGEIERGGLTFNRRIGRQDDFFDTATGYAREQALDLQVVRTHAVQRRRRSHQHVVDAAEFTRLLHHRDVLRFFDDANQALVA